MFRNPVPMRSVLTAVRSRSSWRSCSPSFSSRRSLSGRASAADDEVPPPLTLDEALGSQDPHGRIRYHQIEQISNWNEDWTLALGRELAPHNPVGVSVEIIPFWTMLYAWEGRWAALDTKTGVTSDQRVSDRVDFGLTIAAVEKSHWASGLILTEECHALARYTTHELFAPLKSTDTWVYGPTKRLNSDIWDPDQAPKFALGYPKLSRDFLEWFNHILGSNGTLDGRRVLGEVTAPLITYAMPTYRVAYKVDCLGQGTEGYTVYGDGPTHLDMSDPGDPPTFTDLYYFKLPKHGPKISPVVLEDSAVGSLAVYRKKGPAEMATHPKSNDELGSFKTTHGKQLEEVFERIVSALYASKLDWNDPNIIPADFGPQLNVFTLMEWERNRLLNRQSWGPPPRLFNKPTSSSLPRFSRPPPLRPPTRPSRQPGPTSSSSKPNEPPRPSAYIPRVPPVSPAIPTTNTPLRPAPIADTERLYAMLGLEPTPDYLSSAKAQEIDGRIKSRFYYWSMLYHPDRNDRSQRQRSPEAKSESGEITQSRLNSAYARINTLAGRQEYSALQKK